MRETAKYKTVAIVHSILLLIFAVHVVEEIMTRFFLAVMFGIWFQIVAGAGFAIFAAMIPWLWKGAKWALYGSLLFAIVMTVHALVHIYILVYLRDALGTITGISALLISIPYMVFLSRMLYKPR